MIRLRAIGPCDDFKIEQFAILTYDSAADTESDLDILERHQNNKFTFEEELYKGIASTMKTLFS